MASFSATVVQSHLTQSLRSAVVDNSPFRHWTLKAVLPERTAQGLRAIQATPPDVSQGSGRRELHNDSRTYLAGARLAAPGPLLDVARAFQSPAVVLAFMALTGAMLLGSYLRLELALDLDGFWLEPHTDLGVKLFTLLLALPDGRRQAGLGTDLYNPDRSWAKRLPFAWNAGLVFRPAEDTWHGFEPRPIAGVRRSLIVNYVTPQWRDRDQLAFPDEPIAV